MEVKGIDEDEGLEEFMEAVTMYRCKFCAYTATGTREMAQHVKSTHVLKAPAPENAAVPKNVVRSSRNLVNIVKPATENIPAGEEAQVVSVEDSSTVTASMVNNEQNQLNSSNSLSQSMNSAMPVSTLTAGTSDSLAQNVILSLSDRSEQIIVQPMPVSQVPEVTYLGQQIGDYHFICQNPYGQYVLQNSGGVQLGNTNTVNVLVQDSNAKPKTGVDASMGDDGELCVELATGKQLTQLKQDLQLEDDIEESKQIENEDDVITKELYLCGNCSEGFATIQACKDHMTLVHDVTDFQTSCRVDAGTQVEPKKRPGRKKKSEIVQPEKKEEEELVMSDTDEDWAEQLMTYSTRSHRKRKPPQALRNDYYLGRTKIKEQKKREPRELNIACEVEDCTVRFQSEETMKKHLECHLLDAGITGPQFRCKACDEQFDHWKQTRIHMWKTHKIAVDLHSCPLCDNYKTDTPSKLKIHLETHGEVRAYSCPECGKAFKQFSQLKNHETCHLSPELVNSKALSDRWHTPKTCDICGRRFVNVKCMKKHKEAVHAGRKDFKCTYCNYECARKAMLVLHLRVHTGDKPFKCEHCSYSCGDHNSLRRHKMRHTGQKPYRCPHCPYASIQAISLKVHVKNKHPGMGGIYCCELCLYKTVNKRQFDNHQMDHKYGLIKTEPNVKAVQIDGSKHSQSKTPEAILIGPNTQTVYSGFADSSNVIQVFQPEFLQNAHIQEVTDLPGAQRLVQASALVLEDGHQNQVKLQPKNETEDRVVENNTGPEPNDVATAQLVYAALNAISENPQNGVESLNSHRLISGVESGELQTTIETHLKEGEATYKITFHLPEGEEISREITVRDESALNSGTNASVTRETDWQENSTSMTETKQET